VPDLRKYQPTRSRKQRCRHINIHLRPPGSRLDAFACTLCNAGEVSDQSFCLKCPPGKYARQKTNDCRDCAPGKYQTQAGSTSCISCTSGQHKPTAGSVFCSSQNSNDCEDCPAGQFQNETGKAQCISCERGTYTPKPGSIFCLSCVPGKFQNSAVGCALCPTGKYQNATAQTECMLCASGKCSHNEASLFCTSCPIGKYQANANQCVTCPTDTFRNEMGQAGCNKCAVCPIGSRVGCAGASSGYCANVCAPGNFVNNSAGGNASGTCTPCPASKYQQQPSMPNCSLCSLKLWNVQRSSC
jgi:hypothetical protein